MEGWGGGEGASGRSFIQYNCVDSLVECSRLKVVYYKNLQSTLQSWTDKKEQKCPLPLYFPVTCFGGGGGVNFTFNLSKVVDRNGTRYAASDGREKKLMMKQKSLETPAKIKLPCMS